MDLQMPKGLEEEMNWVSVEKAIRGAHLFTIKAL
jgi:hypothetical protein